MHGRSSDQEISTAVYEKVLAEVMPTTGICSLGGTNYGEMTISKNFHRFVRDCERYQVRISLTTNGTRMADEWLGDLAKNLWTVGFSMEGIQEQFELIRGYRWHHFVNNIRKLIAARATARRYFRVEWRYCAHADSIHQLPDMIRMARDLGIDHVAVMNLVHFVPAQKYKRLTHHRSLANRYFREARQLAAETGVSVSLPPDFSVGTWDLPGQPAQGCGASCAAQAADAPVGLSVAGRTVVPATAKAGGDSIELNSCWLPWQTCSINELGQVRPCCTYWRPMGSLAKRSFEEVWNSRAYRKLRGGVNTAGTDAICYACRRPRFDSEDNASESQLLPALPDLLRAGLKRLVARRKVTYTTSLQADHAPDVQVWHQALDTPSDQSRQAA